MGTKLRVTLLQVGHTTEAPEKTQLEVLSEQPAKEDLGVEVELKPFAKKATPKSIVIGTLADDRLRLIKPLTVELEHEGSSFIAKCDIFDEFGYGENSLAAVDDLRLTLAELYWTLKDEQERLGRNLSEVWARLQETVAEK